MAVHQHDCDYLCDIAHLNKIFMFCYLPVTSSFRNNCYMPIFLYADLLRKQLLLLLSMLKTVVVRNIFVVYHVHFFQDSRMIESTKEQHLFEIKFFVTMLKYHFWSKKYKINK